ncbi:MULTISPECIES: ABC transporter permease [Anaerotruncus]|jgi:spermidine/putrescine transport system permease protein|uniref:ABC transporter permease n=1 Tax=Anaerotruncus TaxID=244127 RepID=UPI00082BCDC3|nr:MULTISPECIES: ABC transporter permease subunit [Anaerotruncus]RGX56988.1 ABC transporter permease subunit [Anaerotruncus sp. AF02-27]
MKTKNRLAAVPFAVWTALFVAIPLVYIVCMSFMRRAETWGVVAEFSLESYRKMFSPTYLKVYAQSMWLALLTTLFTLGIGYPFAYCVAKLPEKRRAFVLLLVIVPFWTNSLVRIYGWMILLRGEGIVNSLLIFLGMTDSPLKLLYNFGAVLVGMVYALIPFMILSVYHAVAKLDPALTEASRDLGAGKWKAFWTVTVPLTRAGIMAGCVLVFVPSVGLFFVSDLLGGAKTMLLGNLIKNELLTARNWPMGAALSVVMMLMAMAVIAGYRKASGESSLEGIV